MTDLPTRFFTAIERGDIDAVRACYAPDARVWHNTDGLDFPGQTVDENLRVLRWMSTVLQDRRYDIVRRVAFAEGFMQQHVLRATIAATGADFAMAACIVCLVENDRITRLEEYMDSAATAPLVALARA